jgi:hypothetical protein
MSLVVDANITLALVLPLPYSQQAEQLYLALAEALKCASWTAGQRLIRVAQQYGDWIHSISEMP